MMRLVFAIVGSFLVLANSSPPASTNIVAAGFVAVTTGSGSMQISAFNLDGSNERRLTTGPSDHHYPSLSPDGTELLYTGDERAMDEIYRLTLADPAVPVQITKPPIVASSASWSPDGRSIVYSALAPGAPAYQIFTANPDGSKPVQLTKTLDSGNTQPVFSPDGARIAYINGRRATSPGPNGSTVTGIADRIWVMAADGSGAAPLTQGPLDAYPAWLDRGTIMFARSSFISDMSQVISVGLDGHEQVQSPPNQYFVEPKPLPDGRSYGATQEMGSELHLVKVSRTDGAGLMAPATSEFVIERLAVPQSDGSSFTLAWILAPARPRDGGAPRPLAPLLPALLLVALGVGFASFAMTYRRRHR